MSGGSLQPQKPNFDRTSARVKDTMGRKDSGDGVLPLLFEYKAEPLILGRTLLILLRRMDIYKLCECFFEEDGKLGRDGIKLN
jgi:hypothetical protein